MADRKLPSPAEAKGQRGRMFKVQGTVTSVEPVADPDAESLWRYTVTLSERPYRAVVYLASPNTAAGGQRVEFDGLFAKYVPGTGAEQMAVFVAPRLERRGDSPLANLGMDLGLLEGIRDYSPMTAADHDAFYHLLLLARNADLARLQRDAEQLDGSPRGLPALFSAPAAQRGRLVRLAGMVQRVVRVPVDDAAVAARLGADHFFEIDLMAEGSQGNPLVFCTLDLPAGMPLVEQPSSGEQVDVTGFFFKTWQYPVKLSQAEKDASPGSTWARQPPAGDRAGTALETGRPGEKKFHRPGHWRFRATSHDRGLPVIMAFSSIRRRILSASSCPGVRDRIIWRTEVRPTTAFWRTEVRPTYRSQQ